MKTMSKISRIVSEEGKDNVLEVRKFNHELQTVNNNIDRLDNYISFCKEVFRHPMLVAYGEGNYYISERGTKELQVLFSGVKKASIPLGKSVVDSGASCTVVYTDSEEIIRACDNNTLAWALSNYGGSGGTSRLVVSIRCYEVGGGIPPSNFRLVLADELNNTVFDMASIALVLGPNSTKALQAIVQNGSKSIIRMHGPAGSQSNNEKIRIIQRLEEYYNSVKEAEAESTMPTLLGPDMCSSGDMSTFCRKDICIVSSDNSSMVQQPWCYDMLSNACKMIENSST